MVHNAIVTAVVIALCMVLVIFSYVESCQPGLAPHQNQSSVRGKLLLNII